MKASAILMLAFAALGLACTIPFNNRTLFENSTLLHETLASMSNTATQGWTDAVSWNNPHRAWRADKKDKITRIYFCYSNEWTFKMFEADMLLAWKSGWMLSRTRRRRTNMVLSGW
jgi:hypothetical protein